MSELTLYQGGSAHEQSDALVPAEEKSLADQLRAKIEAAASQGAERVRDAESRMYYETDFRIQATINFLIGVMNISFGNLFFLLSWPLFKVPTLQAMLDIRGDIRSRLKGQLERLEHGKNNLLSEITGDDPFREGEIDEESLARIEQGLRMIASMGEQMDAEMATHLGIIKETLREQIKPLLRQALYFVVVGSVFYALGEKAISLAALSYATALTNLINAGGHALKSRSIAKRVEGMKAESLKAISQGEPEGNLGQIE